MTSPPPNLDPDLGPLIAGINEAFDFKDEVARVLANKDDSGNIPPPTDDDDHGDGDDEDADDDPQVVDMDWEEDLMITVPRHLLGKTRVTITLTVDKR